LRDHDHLNTQTSRNVTRDFHSAGFIIPLGILGGWAPLAVNVALTGFEFLVAFLQAYVFTVLTCLYLHDAIHLH